MFLFGVNLLDYYTISLLKPSTHGMTALLSPLQIIRFPL